MIVGFFPSASPSVTSCSHLRVIRTWKRRVYHSRRVGNGSHTAEICVCVHIYMHARGSVQRGVGTWTDKEDTKKWGERVVSKRICLIWSHPSLLLWCAHFWLRRAVVAAKARREKKKKTNNELYHVPVSYSLGSYCQAPPPLCLWRWACPETLVGGGGAEDRTYC